MNTTVPKRIDDIADELNDMIKLLGSKKIDPEKFDQTVLEKIDPDDRETFLEKIDEFYQVICYETDISNPNMQNQIPGSKWLQITEMYQAYKNAEAPEQILSDFDDDKNFEAAYQYLKSGFISWMIRFIKADGINCVLEKIAQTSQDIRFYPTAEVSSKLLDKLHTYLDCLFEIFNALDINTIVNIMDSRDADSIDKSIYKIINILVFSLFPGEHQINSLIFQLFCPIINNAKEAPAVLDAMESYSNALGLSGKFSIVSDTANFNEPSCRFSSIVFVNLLFKNVPELYRRVSIRYELYEEGFKTAIEDEFTNDSERVKQEVNYFKLRMINDEKAIRKIFGRSGISPMSAKSTANSILEWPDASKDVSSFLLELVWVKNISKVNFVDYLTVMVNFLTALHHCESDDEFAQLSQSIWSNLPI